MNYIIGLGNPEDQYEGTRHNIGRDIVTLFAKKNDFPEFEFDKKTNALVSVGEYVYIPAGKKTKKKEEVTLILPDTYMNKSGVAVKKYITSVKKAETTMIVHDDLDLGIGTAKITFNKGAGGHRGLESIIKAIRTKSFSRMRIGISPVTVKGKIKKPSGEEKVVKHVLGKFSPKEQDVLKKVKKNSIEALGTFVSMGRARATGELNSKN